MSQPAVLPAEFYRRHSLDVARDLLGRTLVRRLPDGTVLGGRIVETEAYTPNDPSCHAYKGVSTRTHSMFQPGGIAYVYLIYGMYHCLNVVTQATDEGAAVLIRAIEPTIGVEAILASADRPRRMRDIARGPGRLCRALAIDRTLDGTSLSLTDGPLYLLDGAPVADQDVLQTPRIGINVTPEATAAPWRLIISGNPFVSGSRAQNSAAQGALGSPLAHGWFDRL